MANGKLFFAYGSLMDPEELRWAGVVSSLPPVPARLQGYRRVFSQEPSWRKKAGVKRAVLTLDPWPSAWVNGVLLPGLAPEQLLALARRERGYLLRHTAPVALEPYQGQLPIMVTPLVVFVGKPQMRNNGLLPNPRYLNRCLRGAQHWGTDFHRDFLLTTYLGDGRPLLSP